MAAKLVIAVAAVVVITGLLTVAALRYFQRKAELDHEERMKEKEQRHEEQMELLDDEEL